MVVQRKQVTLRKSFFTEEGVELKHPVAAYEEYGVSEGPVVLVCHGGLSDPHAAGVNAEGVVGWFDPYIGADKVVDTSQYRVLCINSLGGMFGTVSAESVDPDTGKPYRSRFPRFTLVDQAEFMYQVLLELGVKEVAWAMGVSMGSMNAAQLAVLHPEFVKALTPIATAAYMPAGGMAYHDAVARAIELHPDFNGGEYEDGSHISTAIQTMSIINKIYYTHYSLYESMVASADPCSQDAKDAIINSFLMTGSEAYAAVRDPNCMRQTVLAVNTYHLARGFANLDEALARLNMPVLIINIAEDGMFPPKYGQEFADGINKNHPGGARFEVISSKLGHLGCVAEPEQIGRLLVEFKSEHAI